MKGLELECENLVDRKADLCLEAKKGRVAVELHTKGWEEIAIWDTKWLWIDRGQATQIRDWLSEWIETHQPTS